MFDNSLWRVSGQKEQLNKTPLLNKWIFKSAESYSFWDYITDRDFAGDFLYEIEENIERRKSIRLIFANMVKYQNRKRLAFKLTGPARLGYLRSIFPDAKFKYVKREPLPNIRSLLKVGFYQDRKDKLSWSGPYLEKEQKAVAQWAGNNLERIAALQYYKVNEIYNLEKASIESQIMEIAYENFIKDPHKEIKRILDFVDLDQDDRIRNYLKHNKIYNRNTIEKYYFSSIMDKEIENIAVSGIQN